MRLFSQGRIAEESGATLVEFAVTLPLLVVVLYAVFDFGSVYSLKQKLGSAVYECARAGASQSPGNLKDTGVDDTGSVGDLKALVANSLKGSGLNDCGLLASAGATSSPPPFATWVYNVTAPGCPGSLKLTIERQNVVTAGAVKVIYTHVHLEYPFQWQLGKVIQLVSPAGTFPVTILTADAAMPNLN